jgi:hypothetical protein
MNYSYAIFRVGLFHSYLTRLRMNSESNSKSRLKTTKGKFIVRFNGLELLALNYGLRHATLSVQDGLCLE